MATCTLLQSAARRASHRVPDWRGATPDAANHYPETLAPSGEAD